MKTLNLILYEETAIEFAAWIEFFLMRKIALASAEADEPAPFRVRLMVDLYPDPEDFRVLGVGVWNGEDLVDFGPCSASVGLWR